jgi:hypothetical protein
MKIIMQQRAYIMVTGALRLLWLQCYGTLTTACWRNIRITLMIWLTTIVRNVLPDIAFSPDGFFAG